MAITVKPVARKKPGTSEVKYYYTQETIKVANEKDVAELMCEENTINRREADLAIHEMSKAINFLLRQGYNVKFEDLGTFSATIQSEGAEAEKDLTVTMIRKVMPHCRFSKDFMEKLQKSEFKVKKEKGGE